MKMNYKKKLEAFGKEADAVWHFFQISLKSRKFDYYVAVEGEEDDVFYSKFLDSRFPHKKFRTILCNGKNGVMALKFKILETYGTLRNVFFFVDSDHDAFLKKVRCPDNTFFTCGYAVENYFLDSSVVLSGIRKHFRLSQSDELFEDIRKEFETDLKLFEARAKSFMAYVIALRVNGQNPSLDEVDFHSIFVLVDGKMRRKSIDCTELLEAAKVSHLDTAEVFRHARNLRNVQPFIFVRGKLVAQFILQFCRKLEKRFESREKLNGMPLKSDFDFGRKNLISVFVDFVKPPIPLVKFFDEMEITLDAVSKETTPY